MWMKVKSRLLYKVLRHVPQNREWVFGIGLSKTGTTSLSEMLAVLGYSDFHLPPIARVDIGGRIAMDWPWWVYRYDALTDLTVAVLWHELDEMFPNAKFIYTPRDMDSWLDSCRRHFSQELADMRITQGQEYLNDLCRAVYGSYLFDEQSFHDAYILHEAKVLEHFSGRDNFLYYDLIGGDGWGPLCTFLERPVPNAPVPRSNLGRSVAPG